MQAHKTRFATGRSSPQGFTAVEVLDEHIPAVGVNPLKLFHIRAGIEWEMGMICPSLESNP